MNKLVTYGGALASDIISTVMPGASTLAKFVDSYAERKRKEAADIFINEVSQGYHGRIDFDEHDLDPLIGIVHRFWKAVEDGAARENLRLLAQVIAGLKKNKALEDVDQFRKWAGILEQLTRDELLVLGKALRVRRDILNAGTDVANDFWQRLECSLEAARYSKSEIGALCASVSRTGLLIPLSGFGALTYMDTPWLENLGKLADLENLSQR